MITIHADDHRLHSGLLFARGDAWEPSSECPERADNVLTTLRDENYGSLIDPRTFDDESILRIHAPDYVQFLENVWADWEQSDEVGSNARPDTFVYPGMRPADTECVMGKLGRYSFDAGSPFVAGSWQAIRTSANIALTGAALIDEGESRAFALCRPPGHHATANYCGGYCYLNNSALAAQYLLDAGAERIAILDVDYHHGNGTQTIFYERDDVMTVSLHADPSLEYPFFIGYADEHGAGRGEGFNHNYPMPFGTDWQRYAAQLAEGLAKVRRYGPDVVIAGLGLDTFVDDPTTFFAIETDDFGRMGEAIASLGLPTLTVLEGGYSVEHIGHNTLAFLRGLEGG